MSQNLQKFDKFQKIQLENLVDFEKCCKTHIFLQKSEPIQPKTSNMLPKFCQPTLSDVAAMALAAAAGDVRVRLPGRTQQAASTFIVGFFALRPLLLFLQLLRRVSLSFIHTDFRRAILSHPFISFLANDDYNSLINCVLPPTVICKFA